MPFAVLTFTLCPFLPPQQQKAESCWCPGHQSLRGYLTCKTTPAQARKDSGTIASFVQERCHQTLSLHFSTFEDIFLPPEILTAPLRRLPLPAQPGQHRAAVRQPRWLSACSTQQRRVKTVEIRLLQRQVWSWNFAKSYILNGANSEKSSVKKQE